MIDLPPITLDAQQAEVIMQESLSRGLFERDVDGRAPTDPKVIMEVAQEIVRQARLARIAGNRGDAVTAILYLANLETDQPTSVRSEGEPDQMSTATAQPALTDAGKFPPEHLRKFESSLMKYPTPHSQDVIDGLEKVRAELKRRGEPTALGLMHAAAPVPEQPSSAPAPVPAPQPVAQAAPAPVVTAPAPPAPPVIAENMPPVAAEQAPPADDAERTALLDRLTFPIMRQHGIDPSQIDALTIDQLSYYIDGVALPVQAQQQVDPAHAAPAVVEPPPAGVTAPAPPPIAAVPEDPDALSPEREELEGQVTGPMLKVYRRGRRDIPDIGDNELRLMVENPTGQIAQSQLDDARALDTGGASAAPAPPVNPAPVSRAPLSPPEASEAADQVRDEAREGQVQQLTIQHNAPASSAFAPTPASAPEEPAKKARAASVPVPPSEPLSTPIPVTVQEGLADQIVAQERLPIPPEVEDEPPVLPADMSKLPRDEIYSLHARFHALESRVGWVLGVQEDALADIEKLRRGREVEVANSLPAKVGTTKMTEAQRDAQIAADEGVINYAAAEHEMKKVIRRLRFLVKDYHNSVERASRQMTKYSQEYGGGR